MTDNANIKELVTRTDVATVMNGVSSVDMTSAITDCANTLHRRSMRAPGNMMVVNKSFLSRIPNFSPGVAVVESFKKASEEYGIEFEGTHNMRQAVFTSNDIPDNTAFVFLVHEGLAYIHRKTEPGEIPYVDIVADETFKKGDIKWFAKITT